MSGLNLGGISVPGQQQAVLAIDTRVSDVIADRSVLLVAAQLMGGGLSPADACDGAFELLDEFAEAAKRWQESKRS